LFYVRKSRILESVQELASVEFSALKVLGTEVLDKAQKAHGDLASSVAVWLSIARESKWSNLAEVRRTWRNTDCVKGKTIFNIKGNRYRLIAILNYASQTIVVKMLLTHAEYSSGGWQS
jgi:mRNA interferase HigB